MVIDRVVTDLLFIWMAGITGNGKLCPLAAGVQPIEDVVEDLEQGNLAFVATLGGA